MFIFPGVVLLLSHDHRAVIQNFCRTLGRRSDKLEDIRWFKVKAAELGNDIDGDLGRS